MRTSRNIAIILFLVMVVSPVFAGGDPLKGRELARTHCSRCHVIGNFNKFGGIGSTPSFQLIAGMKDGIVRFQSFFERRPHPVFVRVPNVPRWSEAPPYAIEFTVTADTLEDLMAFVKTIKKKDLSKIPVIGKFLSKRRK